MSMQVRTQQTRYQPNATYGPPRSRAAARAIFILSAAAAAWIGGWAESAPNSFYRSFPGFGRHWISALGPYNEHLLRDFGGLNLGLAAACLVAAVALTRSAAMCASAASLAYALPHILFHALHTEALDTADNVATLASVAISAIAPVAATALLWRARTQP